MPNSHASHTPSEDSADARARRSSSASSSTDDPTRVGGDSLGAGHNRDPIPLGPSIEGYALKNEVHRGGQGVVYRAVQLGTKREVALKVLLEGPYASESARRRFEREIELAAALRHPNIVTILDSGLSLGRYFFAMEYIRGQRLDRYLAQQRPGFDKTLELFEQVCQAVNYAHQRGVIHRDLKPPNILVDDQGEPHILDFGLAKQMPAAGDETTLQVLSTSGQILGTVAYMSPEQAAGSHDVDVRSDVYSLGVIFYEALIGQPPYPVSGPLGEVLNRIARDDPMHPRAATQRSTTRPLVDDEVATILLKTLEKEPQRRYQTAGDLARDLRHRLNGDPIEAKRASGLYMLRKALRRYRLQAAAAGTVLMMLVAFLIIFAVLFTRERDASQRARELTKDLTDALDERQVALDDATQAEADLRRALMRQHIQRGDLALTRDDPIEARDSYWAAYDLVPGPAAQWALRRFYLETANAGSFVLAYESRARSKLSPNGQIAAVATTDGAIVVRDLGSGAVLNWVRLPLQPKILDVKDSGAVAAAGPDWLRVWQPRELRPVLASELPNLLGEPLAVDILPDDLRVIVITSQQAALLAAPNGQLISGLFLQGRSNGRTTYQPDLGHVAVATDAGVELVTVSGDRLAAQTVWPNDGPPRDVRFDGTAALGVLVDDPDAARSKVHIAPVEGLINQLWPQTVDLSGTWELMDLDSESQTIALADARGRLAVYRDGELLGEWQSSGVAFEELQLSSRHATLVTRDDQNTVNRWVPAQYIEQKREIIDDAPIASAASADGRVVLLGFERGRVSMYRPAQQRVPDTLVRPRLFNLGSQVELDVDAAGKRAMVLDGSNLRFVDLQTREDRVHPWPRSRRTSPRKVIMSDDGAYVAVMADRREGESQFLTVLSWDDEPRSPFASTEFIGAVVNDLVFIPNTHELLIARSNGELMRIDVTTLMDAETENSETTMSRRVPPWLTLDVAARQIRCSPAGDSVAAACEDQTLRLLHLANNERPTRVSLGSEPRTMAFHPSDDLLLVRTADGAAHLLATDTGERVSRWRLDADTQTRPLAIWIGTGDAMLLGYGDGVWEHRYQFADQLIELGRPLARQRELARHLADREFARAWDTARDLTALSPELGHNAEVSVLEATLRAASEIVPAEWTDRALADADAATFIRLGHAAYDGGRFELAARWLRRGRDVQPRVDAFTAWRSAACTYLADNYSAAADALASVAERRDLASAFRPIVAMQQVAALTLAGRSAEARAVVARIAQPGPAASRGRRRANSEQAIRGIVATQAARVIGRLMTDLSPDNSVEANWDTLLPSFFERERLVSAYAEPLLQFYDDVHFFTAEVARQRGHLAEAAVEYQRCIDVARDTWPADWAAYRLAQLADESNLASAPEE